MINYFANFSNAAKCCLQLGQPAGLLRLNSSLAAIQRLMTRGINDTLATTNSSVITKRQSLYLRRSPAVKHFEISNGKSQKNVLKQKKSIPAVGMKTTDIFRKNLYSQSRTIINIGGARSSKSYSIAQLLLMRANNGKKTIAITRKTMPALKRTAYQLFIDLLKEYNRYIPKNHNRTDDCYTLGQSKIYFFSLDSAEKIKSTEFNYIWLEEANEFNYEDYMVLLTRLSAKTKNERNQIFLSLNPSEKDGWIPEKLMHQKDVEVINSTYKDNPFLSKDYIKTLKELKFQDKNYYQIYALGQWGETGSFVYTLYDFCDDFPENCEETIWGLDFGFNNPSALVKIAFKDGNVYVSEKLYACGLSTQDIISRLRAEISEEKRHQYIFADSSEPDRISEIFSAGFNIHPAEKSVKAGIEAVKGMKLFITKDSANLIKEIKNYKWKTDVSGKPLEEPVKFNDHAMDALRYGVYSFFKSRANTPKITVF